MFSFVPITTVLHAIQCVGAVPTALSPVLAASGHLPPPPPCGFRKPPGSLPCLCVTEVTAAFSYHCLLAQGQPQHCLVTNLVFFYFLKKASNVRPSVSGIEHLCDLSL